MKYILTQWCHCTEDNCRCDDLKLCFLDIKLLWDNVFNILTFSCHKTKTIWYEYGNFHMDYEKFKQIILKNKQITLIGSGVYVVVSKKVIKAQK